MPKIIGNTTTTPMAVPDWNQTDETKADFIKNKPDIAGLQNDIDAFDIALTRFSETTLPAFESRVENIETNKADKATTLFGYGITDAAGLEYDNIYTAHNIFKDTVYFGGGEDGWIEYSDGTLDIRNDIGALRLSSDDDTTLTISDVVIASSAVEAPAFVEDGVALKDKYLQKTKMSLTELQSELGANKLDGSIIEIVPKKVNSAFDEFIKMKPLAVPRNGIIYEQATIMDYSVNSVFQIITYVFNIDSVDAECNILRRYIDLEQSAIVDGTSTNLLIAEDDLEFYVIK